MTAYDRPILLNKTVLESLDQYLVDVLYEFDLIKIENKVPSCGTTWETGGYFGHSGKKEFQTAILCFFSLKYKIE